MGRDVGVVSGCGLVSAGTGVIGSGTGRPSRFRQRSSSARASLALSISECLSAASESSSPSVFEAYTSLNESGCTKENLGQTGMYVNTPAPNAGLLTINLPTLTETGNSD